LVLKSLEDMVSAGLLDDVVP